MNLRKSSMVRGAVCYAAAILLAAHGALVGATDGDTRQNEAKNQFAEIWYATDKAGRITQFAKCINTLETLGKGRPYKNLAKHIAAKHFNSVLQKQPKNKRSIDSSESFQTLKLCQPSNALFCWSVPSISPPDTETEAEKSHRWLQIMDWHLAYVNQLENYLKWLDEDVLPLLKAHDVLKDLKDLKDLKKQKDKDVGQGSNSGNPNETTGSDVSKPYSTDTGKLIRICSEAVSGTSPRIKQLKKDEIGQMSDVVKACTKLQSESYKSSSTFLPESGSSSSSSIIGTISTNDKDIEALTTGFNEALLKLGRLGEELSRATKKGNKKGSTQNEKSYANVTESFTDTSHSSLPTNKENTPTLQGLVDAVNTFKAALKNLITDFNHKTEILLELCYEPCVQEIVGAMIKTANQDETKDNNQEQGLPNVKIEYVEPHNEQLYVAAVLKLDFASTAAFQAYIKQVAENASIQDGGSTEKIQLGDFTTKKQAQTGDVVQLKLVLQAPCEAWTAQFPARTNKGGEEQSNEDSTIDTAKQKNSWVKTVRLIDTPFIASLYVGPPSSDTDDKSNHIKAGNGGGGGSRGGSVVTPSLPTVVQTTAGIPICGLTNDGRNLCYFNATMQALNACTALETKLAEATWPVSENLSNIFNAINGVTATTDIQPNILALAQALFPTWKTTREEYKTCLEEYNNRSHKAGDVPPVEPLGSNLPYVAKNGTDGKQQDVHELLITVLDAASGEEKSNALTKIKTQYPTKPGQESSQQLSNDQINFALDMVCGKRLEDAKRTDAEQMLELPETNEEAVKNMLPLTMNITGKFSETKTCSSCSSFSTTADPFTILTLPIPKISETAITLDQCLQQYHAEETLDGANKWHCPTCNQKQQAKKQNSITVWPQTLIIQLRRFGYGERATKVTTQINYPTDWDPQTGAPHYVLKAIVHHSGKSPNAGHYTASVLHDGQWYYANDTTVTKINPNEPQPDDGDQQAYLLFYEKDDAAAGASGSSSTP
ncbi:MAG: hypothetical protein LBF56_00145 [Holosporales bacterium]|jgi:ubiquitin C-terminal hydrolase|nr:hypothetical protein [Holosporales bacterium]